MASTSHYIAVPDEPSSSASREVYTTRHVYSSDEENNTSYDSSDNEDLCPPVMYPAIRSEKSTQQARKEKFDGVWVPQRKSMRKDKENVLEPRVPEPVIPKKQASESRPTHPVDVHPPMFNPQDNQAFQEDPQGVMKKKEDKGKAKKSATQDITMKETSPSEQRFPRQSELQKQVNPRSVLDKVLNTPVTMAVGELLAVSKEVSHQVQEVIKPKSLKPVDSRTSASAKLAVSSEPDPQSYAAAFMPRTRGQLIKLRMECDGIPILAIIDTGSQLNIAHRKAWLNCLSRPMDVTKKILMGDANGGEGVLSGFVADVPLMCGSVLTYANVYIGNKAPFDLLLGRPWQRGNYISIDERIDGT